MKLSELSKYKEYIFYLVNEKYDDAQQALEYCINIARKENDKEKMAFLIQNMGNLYFLKGEEEQAIDYYMKAEKINEKSPLTKYHFAKFLVDKLKRYDEAISKCNEVIKITSSNPWPETEYDSSSNHYLAQCYALQGYCYCLLENFEKAGEKLFLLLEIKEENIIDYAVEFCDLLISNGYFVKEAKDYLSYLLTKLTKSKESKRFEDYIEHIKKIIEKEKMV